MALVSHRQTSVARIVVTRRPDYDLDTPRSSNTDAEHLLPLTPVAEHFPVDVLRRVGNVPTIILVDPAEDDRVLNSLMPRAQHQSPGGFHQHRPRHTAESLEESMKVTMRAAVHEDAKRVVMRGATWQWWRRNFMV